MTEKVDTFPTGKLKGRFVSLQTKLILGFTLIFTVVFASTYYWFYDFAQREAMNQIKEGLYDTIIGATRTGILDVGDTVQIIDGDEMEGLVNEGQVREDGLTDDQRYWDQVEVLCQIRRVEPRASPYTYIAGENPGEIIFIASWGACLPNPDWEQFVKFRIPYTSNTGPNLAGLEQVVFQTDTGWCTYDDVNCVPEIYGDKFGSWVSAYAPIINSSGKTIGALGIDFTSTYVNQVREQILRSIYIAFSTTYIILVVLVYFVSQFLTRPMVGLTRAAEQIGEGNYETGLKYLGELGLSDKYPDEIETMQGVFKGMVDKVYKREEILRQQVRALKIEIDQTKRQKQVEEIVDSEFFQDLRTKAQKMRDQQKSKEKPT
jgi:energy-coupling factor transporter transmembrane protein EcfT